VANARHRDIPNWYELDWDHVQRGRDTWEPVVGADLALSASEPLTSNLERLAMFLDGVT